MIIFSHKCGQLGNRLFAFAHLIANARANQYRVINLSFDEYARYFHYTSKDVWCRFPATESFVKYNWVRSFLFICNKAIVKILRRINYLAGPRHEVVVADLPQYSFHDSRFFSLEEASFREGAKQKKFVFLFGRFFRDYSNLQKYSSEIREFLRPLPAIEKNVLDFITQAKDGADVLVGVHMRKGDYKEFAGGKYLFGDEEYLDKMMEIGRALNPKKVRFVLCSNEPIDLGHFKDVEVCRGPGRLLDDMMTLASCDLIMGPPSTYTLWASFYGEKPLCQIRDIKTKVELAHFQILPPEVLFNFSFN